MSGRISFTEASTLADCEEKWRRKYLLRQEDPGNRFTHLGTMVHTGIDLFWHGQQWLAITEAISGEALALGANDETWDDALWLVRRYIQRYAQERQSVTSYQSEVEVEFPFHGVMVRARLDGLKVEDDRLWVVERKTMSRWDKIDYVQADPQVSLYWLAVKRGLHLEPFGIEYDAVYTHRWKPTKPTQKDLIEARSARDVDFEGWTKKRQTEWARLEVAQHAGFERPAEDSFRRVYIDRTEEQEHLALEWLAAIIDRRRDLDYGARHIKNVGPSSCRMCPFKVECLDGLVHIEMLEEGSDSETV